MSSLSDLLAEVPAYIPNPQVYEDAAQNLRHTLAVFDHPEAGGPVDPDTFVVMASVGFTEIKTGLTWRDLQLIEGALHRLERLDK